MIGIGSICVDIYQLKSDDFINECTRRSFKEISNNYDHQQLSVGFARRRLLCFPQLLFLLQSAGGIVFPEDICLAL
ncbi:unnamed protein product [Pneumocystis jirovecii]|uniref:Uncharacterized protein n=1 Tax=Pneumocystis jirovecii TaxID=42068 RepID=L0PA81_PNEJI|nr:unnamed protein product [Pneumocystis jirovecii]